MRSLDNCWGENCCDPNIGSNLKALMEPLNEQGSLFHMLHNWADNMMVTEDNDKIEVTVAAPGAQKDNISITMHNVRGGRASYLEVQWKSASSSNINNAHVRWMGKAWNSCYKSIPIPEICNKDAITADFKDGQLIIAMPKNRDPHAADEISRTIKIRDAKH